MFAASQQDGRERGAFLFNAPGGGIRVGEIVVGESGRVVMGPAPIDAIGVIHTHSDAAPANPLTGEKAIPGGPPSGDDIKYLKDNHVHGVVVERNHIYYLPYPNPEEGYAIPRGGSEDE
jgi:hypothetical protein